MKLGPNKKRIKEFLIMNGWTVILIGLLSYMGFYWALNAIDSIKDYERIDYFIESYSVKVNTLAADTVSLLKDNGVLESHVYDVSPDADNKNTKFARFGAYSDICILNRSDLDDVKEVIGDNFVPLSSAFKANFSSGLTKNYSFYSAYGDDYAIKIYDPSDPTYSNQFTFTNLMAFSKEGSTPEAYYLVVPILSVNYGAKTTNGFAALNYFLSTYEAQ